ncbi:MAG: phage integrase SAM-like domain-containing protein [Lachnospiraceae bacterium]
MAEKVKRTKTKYKSIYFNESTKKYDIKYNFKEYDVKTGKNKYRAKWIYNLNTLSEAKQELAKLQTGQVKADDKDITLKGIFELWKIKAEAQDFSPVTIRTTAQHIQMIYKFLPDFTKFKDIDEDVYYRLCSDVRNYKYADETLHGINATFRKMINLAYKKKLITINEQI